METQCRVIAESEGALFLTEDENDWPLGNYQNAIPDESVREDVISSVPDII
eukprot:UN12629